jgi:DNA-binding MarR family transcriptional regulator
VTREDDTCPHPLPDGSDPLSASVLMGLRRVMRLNRQLLMRNTSDLGGHPAQAGCLRVLRAHEDMTQRDLGELLFVSPAALTTMLQRMERQGLIVRRPDETDQRLVRIRLTEDGRELSDQMLSAFATYVDTTIGPLSVADRTELARLLELLGDNLSAALETADIPSDPEGRLRRC